MKNGRKTLLGKQFQDAPPTPAGSPEQQRALVSRLVESAQFQRSPRLREFLLYIADRTLHDHQEAVTEQQIGIHVFQRPEHYNPGDDNIVRASARQLRLKIRDYFETEGKDEAWYLDVPKGSYVPVFRPREPRESPPPESATDAPRIGLRRFATLVALSAAALLAVVAAVLLWRENAALQSQLLARRSTPNLVSTVLLDGGKRLNVIVADSALPLIQILTGNRMPLEDYAARKYVPRGWLFEKSRPQADHFWETLATRQTTTLADVNIVAHKVKRLLSVSGFP